VPGGVGPSRAPAAAALFGDVHADFPLGHEVDTGQSMNAETKRLQALMIGNGLLVMIAGMLFGFMLGFSLLEAIDIWPVPAVPANIPGSPKAWGTAHAGAILNGLMVVGVALTFPTLALSLSSARWVAWGLIATAWGNTAFYAFAPFAANRALSMGANKFGEASLLGVLGFAPAFVAAFLVLIALGIAAKAAFARAGEA